MAAVGFAMVAVGAMLIYAGMTGDSLPGAVRDVVQGKAAGGSSGSSGGAPNPGTEAKRDDAQTRRPAQR